MLENSGNETSERYLVIVFKCYTVNNKCNFTPHLMAAELPHIFWFKYFNCFIENYFLLCCFDQNYYNNNR